jgi:hypothetical protein
MSQYAASRARAVAAAQLPHGGVKLRMPNRQLHRTQVLGAPLAQHCFRSARRMRSVGIAVDGHVIPSSKVQPRVRNLRVAGGGDRMTDPKGHFKFETKVHVTDLDEDGDYQAFASRADAGVRFVPEVHGSDILASVPSATGDFAKWLRATHPSLPVSVPSDIPKRVLRGAEVWLPLVYLAGDTSVQIFLNMAASYLYDRAKGALRSDQPRAHIKVVYRDRKAGRTKMFEFSGDGDALGKAIKRFDLNNFFDDGAP